MYSSGLKDMMQFQKKKGRVGEKNTHVHLGSNLSIEASVCEYNNEKDSSSL